MIYVHSIDKNVMDNNVLYNGEIYMHSDMYSYIYFWKKSNFITLEMFAFILKVFEFY